MAIQVFGAPAAVIMLNRAFADTSPGNLIYQNQVAAATANQTAFANDFGAGYASLSNAALAERVLGNLGLLPNAALQTALADYYAANGAANRGFVTLQLCNILASKEGDATYGAAAVAWNSEVATGFNYSANTANTSESSSSSASTGQTFTLTTNVDAVSGGAANDTISGLIGSSGTYTVGDNINGGGGSDTLNLIATTGTATDVVSLDAVENVNVRLLDAADTTDVNAADWSGVAVLSNASSVADSTLRVSGLTLGTQIKVHGQTFVNVDFAGLTSATDTASLVLVNAGSGGGTAVSLSTANTADVTLDTTGSDLLDAINVEVQGANYARIEGGDGLRTITLTGTGTAVINTDDLITSFDASALTGTNRFTFSGRSDVAVVGGAGNDTFVFSTSLNSNDTINGGSGSDTITSTLGAATVRLNSTGVEAATFTVAEADGGAVDFSAAAAIGSVTLAAGTAGNNVALTNYAGSTINLSDDDIGELTVDTVSNVNSVINLGSSTGAVSISAISVNDASALTVNTIGSGTQVVSALLADSDVKSVVVSASGSANLSLTTANFSGATIVTLQAAGSADITYSGTAGFGNTAITTVTLIAADSNDADILVSGNLIRDTSGGIRTLDTVTMNASSGADIIVDGVQMGTSTYSASGTLNNAVTVTLTAGNGSDIAGTADVASGIDLLATAATLTLNLVAQQSGDIYIENVTLGNADAASATGVIGMTMSAEVAQDAVVNIADIAGSGAPVTIGAINVAASGGLVLASAGFTIDGAALNVGTLTIDGGSATMGAVSASAIGAMTLDVKDGGTATIGNMFATSISTISVTVASGGFADFGTFGSADVGNTQRLGGFTVSITGNGSADFGAVAATAGAVGDISITVAGAGSADFDAIAASSVGVISVSGSGWVDIGTVSAVSVAGIDLRNQGSGGTFSIDLSGVTNTVIVDGGRGTTTILSGNNNDEFNLKTGLGADTIRFGATGQGNDVIANFQLGTGGDVIGLSVTALDMLNGSGDAIDASAAAVVDTVVVTAGGTTLAATDNVIIIKATAFASLAEMVSSISKTAGDHTLVNVAGASSEEAGGILVVWSDGTNTYGTLVEQAGSATGIANDASANTLVTLTNVDITQASVTAVAANFAFFTT